MGAAPVVVVGAGPAGCATAMALARRGIEVEILERARLPRDKICGDVLLPEAQRALERLGFDTAPLAARAHRIRRCRYHTPGGQVVEAPFHDEQGRVCPWWVVPRRELDQQLVEAVRALGVTVHEGIRAVDVSVGAGAVDGVWVESGRSRRRWPARAVVAADGAGSTLARRAGLLSDHPAHRCLALRRYTGMPEGSGGDRFDIFTTRATLPGCTWIVPLGDGRANVGVGALQSRLPGAGHGLRDLLDAAAQRHPEFAAVHSVGDRYRGWSLPGASLPRRHSTAGLLLVGDAGGMVDPFTGHGIHTALEAGHMAAEALEAALTIGDLGVDMLGRYDRNWEQRFGLEMKLGWMLQRLCASPRRVEWLVAALNRSAARRELFGGLVGHSFARRRLLDPVLLFRVLLGQKGYVETPR